MASTIKSLKSGRYVPCAWMVIVAGTGDEAVPLGTGAIYPTGCVYDAWPTMHMPDEGHMSALLRLPSVAMGLRSQPQGICWSPTVTKVCGYVIPSTVVEVSFTDVLLVPAVTPFTCTWPVESVKVAQLLAASQARM